MRVLLCLLLIAGSELRAGGSAGIAPLREGVLCLGTGDSVTAADPSCSDSPRQALLKARDLLDVPYLRRFKGVTSAAHVLGDRLPADESLREVWLSLRGEGRRWPVPVAVAITSGKTSWHWGLAENQIRDRQVIRLLPGAYRIVFVAPGHQRFERDLNIAFDTERMDLGTVALVASRSVNGTVLNPERRPVAGCAVMSDGASLGFTDSRGRFDVELPEHPPTSIILSHPQFAPRVLPVAQAGDTRVGSVQLSRGGAIACTIDRQEIGEDSKISAELFQFRAGGDFRRRDTASLAGGETLARFQNLDPGEYAILLTGSGPMEQMVLPVTVGEEAVSEVYVSIAPLRLNLKVTYGGEPLGHASVRLLSSGTLERRVWNPEISLDSDGTAIVDMWQRGMIFAEVRSERLGSTRFAPPALTVSIDERAADWNIAIPRQQVHGFVYDAGTGAPVEGARVFHESEEFGGDARVTDRDGHFSFQALTEGTHVFRVDSKLHLPSERRSLVLTGSSEEHQIEFRLRKGQAIPLEVRDSEGRPMAFAVVIDGCIPGASSRGFKTDEQGALALPSSGEHHSLCVVPMQGSFALAEVDDRPDDPASLQSVPIRVPAPLATIRVSARTTGGLPVAQLGLLLIHNGRVVPPAVMETLSELQRRSSRTDNHGELLLAGMPVGQYEILVYVTDEEAITLAMDRRNVAPVYRGFVGPGESMLDLVIEPRH